MLNAPAGTVQAPAPEPVTKLTVLGIAPITAETATVMLSLYTTNWNWLEAVPAEPAASVARISMIVLPGAVPLPERMWVTGSKESAPPALPIGVALWTPLPLVVTV